MSCMPAGMNGSQVEEQLWAAQPATLRLLPCRSQPLSWNTSLFTKQVQEQLGLHSQAAQRRAGPASPLKAGPAPGGVAPRPGNRFVLPLADCEFMVTKVRAGGLLLLGHMHIFSPAAAAGLQAPAPPN